ncbi:uncharacterized protein LOC142348660 isoform X2 [Convolutriloba macropyga]|uniref:uncharacterized protein LOC142348660 isoform X2 n=1 Tax=Convolutriloba macropyga TaxID=536237 RepID=UPI003F51B15B
MNKLRLGIVLPIRLIPFSIGLDRLIDEILAVDFEETASPLFNRPVYLLKSGHRNRVELIKEIYLEYGETEATIYNTHLKASTSQTSSGSEFFTQIEVYYLADHFLESKEVRIGSYWSLVGFMATFSLAIERLHAFGKRILQSK